MKAIRIPAAILAALAAAACAGSGERPAGASAAPPAPVPRVRAGIDVLLASRLDLLKGKKAGLITNPSGITAGLESAIEALRRTAGVELVALYGPEHGVRGDAQAGESVPFYIDAHYGLPVFSLYGPNMKPQPGMLKGIDEFMRSFDTTGEDKALAPAMTKGIDVLLFDVQDVGTRVYTYQATMAYAMQACAEAGLPFVVLDRPNPVGGLVMEGPILEPAYSSFIGLHPIPLRSGLTMGELARLVNARFLDKKADLTVVAMDGWTRDMDFAATGLPWVIPSPNMPTPETAAVYPGQVCFEGTNVSEGRGTTRPFETFGAPWIDGYELAAALNRLGLPGVRFREQWFTPTFSKFAGERCGGCQLHVTDPAVYRPLTVALRTIAEIRRLYPGRLVFHASYFDKLMGTASVREALERDTPVETILAGFEPGLRAFAETRRPYLLY